MAGILLRNNELKIEITDPTEIPIKKKPCVCTYEDNVWWKKSKIAISIHNSRRDITDMTFPIFIFRVLFLFTSLFIIIYRAKINRKEIAW